MSVRPPLSAFLGRGLSRAGFHGRAYGGDLSGVISRGEVSSLDLSWTDLRPGDYPPLAALVTGNWEGKLSGEIHLAGKEDLRSIEGGGKLTLRGAALTGGNVRGFTIPDLHSTQGDGEFEIKGGRLEIKTLKLAGAEVDLDVRGQLFLRSPLAESVVNATVNVKPIPGANPGIEALLTMLNRNQRPASGTYTLTLYGVLNAVKVR
jgi:type II secretion system protein N